jgi:hypothetical protein
MQTKKIVLSILIYKYLLIFGLIFFSNSMYGQKWRSLKKTNHGEDLFKNTPTANRCELENPFQYVSSPLISGKYWDIKVKDNTAYAVNSWGLMVFDVTDRENPQLVNSIISQYATGFVNLHGQYLIVSGPDMNSAPMDDFGTTIYDISSPHEPEHVVGINVPARDVKILGSTLYLKTWDNLFVYDIEQIESPELLDSIDSTHSCEWAGNYMYTGYSINDTTYIVKIFDVGTPDTPMAISEIEISGEFFLSYLLADNSFLYLGGESELTIIDIENPFSPGILINQQFDNMVAGYRFPKFAKYNNYLFFRGGLILDVSNPSNPLEVGSYYPDGVYSYVMSFYIDENFLYAANWEYGFYIVDIAQPGQSNLKSWFLNFDLYYGVTVQNKYAYVTSMNGLTILDVSNFAHPLTLGVNNDLLWCNAAIIEGDYAYVASDNGVGVFNVANPEDPQLLSLYGGSGNRLIQNGQYLFSTASIVDEIYVYKKKESGALEMVAFYDGIVENPMDLCIKDNYLFVADGNIFNYYNGGGLHVFDISNPETAEEIFISNPDTTRFYRSLALKDDYLFMGSNEPGLYIYNVANPASPELLGFFDYVPLKSGYNCIDIEIFGDSLIVAGEQELYIVDISDIDSLKTVARTFSSRYTMPYTIAMKNNILYDASRLAINIYCVGDTAFNSIPIINNNASITNIDITATPNPFSISTRICYNIPLQLAGEKGTIQIYSMEGRLINTLFENKVQQMGDNEVLWKGVDYNNKKVSDGIYLIALQIGANSFFTKLY